MADVAKSTNARNVSSDLNLEAWFRLFLSANLFSETNKRPSDLGHRIDVWPSSDRRGVREVFQ